MPRRPVHIPLYALIVLVLAAVSGPPLSIFASVRISERNSENLIKRYEADKQASQSSNRVIYCTLFGSQIDALEEAESPVGQALRQSWLDLYKLAQCQPGRK